MCIMSSSNAFNWNFIINLSGSVCVCDWIFGFINLCNTFIQLVNAENVKLYQFNFINYAHVYTHTCLHLFTNQSPTAPYLSLWTHFKCIEATTATTTILEYIAAIGVATTINNRTTFIINRFAAAAAIQPHNVPHIHTVIILLQSSAFTNYVNSSHHISNNYIIIIVIISDHLIHVKHKFSHRFGVWLLFLLCEKKKQPNENCARLEIRCNLWKRHTFTCEHKNIQCRSKQQHQQEKVF